MVQQWCSFCTFLNELPYCIFTCSSIHKASPVFQQFWEQLFTISPVFAFKGFRLLKMLYQNFLKQIHSLPLFYITCTFSEYLCVFIQENKLGLFLGKFLKTSALSFKGLSGVRLLFLRKNMICKNVMQTRFKPVQQWQISNKTQGLSVVKKQNTRSHKH